MSATSSIAEIEGQHVALLPARTVLSLFSAAGGGNTIVGDTCQFTHTAGPTGLLAVLGLGAPASNTAICQPSLYAHNEAEQAAPTP